jgi:Ca2+-binding EF-hand superfamily protein
MDKDRDGSISIQEFIACYVEGEIKLKERLNEVIKNLSERRRQMDEFEARLQDAQVRLSIGE